MEDGSLRTNKGFTINGLGFWHLMPLSTIFELNHGGQFFIGGGNWRTQRKH